MDEHDYWEIAHLRSMYDKGHPKFWSWDRIARYLGNYDDKDGSAIRKKWGRYRKNRQKSIYAEEKKKEAKIKAKKRGPKKEPKPEELEYIRLQPMGTYDVTTYKHNKVREEDRVKHIERVIAWIQFFMSYIFEWDPVPEYIRELIETIYYGTHTIVLEPRKHGKTVTLICLFAYWIIERQETLLVLVADQGAKKRLFFGLRHILKSPLVRYYYGDLLASDNQSDFTMYYVPSIQRKRLDAFVMISSIGGGYVGTHSSWTHLEDVIQRVPVGQDTRNRFIENYDDNIFDLSSKLTASGTRKGDNDFYQALLERGWRVLHRKAIVFIKGDFPSYNDMIFEVNEYDEAKYDIPIGIKTEYLDKIVAVTLDCPNYSLEDIILRYWKNQKSFFTQMQNEVAGKRAKFFKDTIFKVVDPLPEGVLKGKAEEWIDPAFGKSRTSSHTAMVVIAPYDGYLYVMEVIKRRTTPEELEQMIIFNHETFRPKKTRVENDWQQLYKYYERDNEIFDLPGYGSFYNRGEGDKIDRIETLFNYFKFGKIRFFKTCTDLVKARREWASFDSDDGSYDILDILASVVRSMKSKLKSKSRSKRVRTV